jgi:general secretion pathway protein D
MKLIKIFLLTTLTLFATQINLNFKDLDINDFIKMVAKITDKNILISQNLRGKVNFISVKPVNKEEVYQILVNILKSKGYTLVEKNGFLNVVRSSQAIKEAPPLKSNFYQMKTDIIYLKNITAANAYKQVSYLVSRYGRIIINSDKNLLIISDYPDNLKLIKSILSKIDTKNSPVIKITQLKYNDVKTIYPKLREIATTLFNTKIYNYKIIMNENTNSFVIIGPKQIVKSLTKTLNSLDTKPKTLSQITKVIRIKNTDASNLQKILLTVVKQKYKKNAPSITVDKETNSLIIIATPEQMEALKTVISALDIPKEQVYVKARILEISNSKAANIGSKLGLIGGIGDSSGLYTLSANMGGPAIAFDVTSLGLSIPTLKQGLALGATLDLLETTGAAKKLSEPSILCINNTESSIYVGKTVSVITQSSVGSQTTDVTKNTYSRQDIGLTLKVKPRIDSDNKVALNIKAIIEDILPGSQVGLPTTSKRDIDTTTIVSNGQSIIIGGLVRNNKDITINKVPLLGDIPVLGALFRHKQINKDQTTIVIVLTPYIVKKSTDLEKLRLTLSKLNALERAFTKKMLKKINEDGK